MRICPAVTAKGKSEPVAAWRAVAPIGRTGDAIAHQQLSPLVGRAKETGELRGLLESVVMDRSPRAVLLVGEPGIGKTRLLQELFVEADSRPDMITWRQGRCPSYGEGTSFWALAEIVKAHAGLLESEDGPTLAERLEAIVPDVADHAWLVNRLRALVGLEAPPAEREENFTAWLRFLERLACDGPLVLVFEDLHWADEGLLAFVEHLAGDLGAVPLLLVGTARPELLESRPGFGTNGAGLRRLSLGPLSLAETEQLVAGVLGERESHGKSVADVAGRCSGNPFFAEESARLVADQEQGSSVPASVQAVIAARLDALPADGKTAVGDAAVVGEVFWDGALADLGRRERAEVGAVLGALEERRFVRRARDSSLAGEHEFVFRHALVRDVAYGALPRRMRAEKHAQMAEWLERRASGRVEDVAELLAHHLRTALELAQAAGDAELAGRCRAPAVNALRLAGERALRLDVEAAEQLFAEGAAICAADDAGRPALLESWGRSLVQRGRYAEAKDILEESVRGFIADGRRAEAAGAMIELEPALFYLGGQDWRRVLDDALMLTDAEPDSEMRARAMTAIARGEIGAGNYTAGLEWIKRAAAIYARSGVQVPLDLQSWRAQAECGLGDRGAGDRLLAAVRAMRDAGMGRDVAIAYVNYGALMYPFAGPGVFDIAEEGLGFMRSHGIAQGQGILAMNRCSGLISAGRWAEALRRLDESRAGLEREDDNWALNFWWLNRADVFTFMGNGEEALECALVADERAQQWDEPLIRFGSRVTLILALASAGEDELACDLLKELAGVPIQSGYQGYEEFIPAMMRTALKYREVGLAEQLAARLEPAVPLLELALATGRALLAESRGQPVTSATDFAAAAARWHDFGVPYEEAQALLGQGRCLVALGGAPEVRPVLEQAREIFARLGAKPALADTDTLLAQAGGVAS